MKLRVPCWGLWRTHLFLYTEEFEAAAPRFIQKNMTQPIDNLKFNWIFWVQSEWGEAVGDTNNRRCEEKLDWEQLLVFVLRSCTLNSMFARKTLELVFIMLFSTFQIFGSWQQQLLQSESPQHPVYAKRKLTEGWESLAATSPLLLILIVTIHFVLFSSPTQVQWRYAAGTKRLLNVTFTE